VPFTILGIETSCDETSAALVSETGDAGRPWRIHANVVASQAALHREWGGVVPELASRQHIRDICGVTGEAFAAAGLALEQVDAVAVTEGPGLVGSLLVGVSFAKSLAFARGVPLVGVHHLAGHIESIVLAHGEMPLPAVVLVVSGGHTSLYRVDAPGAYVRLGRTRDDAAGEAFDKLAKLLGLGYPGGPIIDRLARQGHEGAVRFPKMRLTHADRNAPNLPGTRDFSFSGLKTAVLRHVTARVDALGLPGPGALPDAERADIAAGFQRSVVGTLVERLMEAAQEEGAASVGIAGGVSANSRLRSLAADQAAAAGVPLFIPPVSLSTDNAAMIAAAGLRRLRAGRAAGWDLNAHASLSL
jgi:N6-L-threonylcarbamoyladenine synthase